MRLIIFVFLFALTGCVPTEFAYSGLTYDSEDQAFYGVAMTTPSNMPGTGSAALNGKWQATSFNQNIPDYGLKSHSGDARLDVNFGTSSVTLNLFGDFVRVFPGGTISGNSFSRTGTTDFWGNFYGSSAGMAAGWMSDHTIFDSSGTSGEFIVGK